MADAGSLPTSTTASPGGRPYFSVNMVALRAVSWRFFFESALPSIMVATFSPPCTVSAFVHPLDLERPVSTGVRLGQHHLHIQHKPGIIGPQDPQFIICRRGSPFSMFVDNEEQDVKGILRFTQHISLAEARFRDAVVLHDDLCILFLKLDNGIPAGALFRVAGQRLSLSAGYVYRSEVWHIFEVLGGDQRCRAAAARTLVVA